MPIAVSNRVIVRNDMGRFIRDVEGAATKTVNEALDEGIKVSKTFAPVGHKADPRTKPIMQSFYKQILSRTSGVWGNSARHALYQEEGTARHDIPGNVSFFWEKYWRMWIPGENIIDHPGNPAHPFLRPAYQIVARRLLTIAKKHYPG